MKRNGKVYKSIVFMILVTTSIIAIGTLDAIAGDTIKIGVVDVYSGPFAHSGPAVQAGFIFAVDEWNKKGGLFGKKIEYIIEDHEMKADVALRKVKKLILEDKVDFINVGTGSHCVLASMPLAEEYKKLLFTTAGSALDITGKKFSKYVFRAGHHTVGYSIGMFKLIGKMPYRKFFLLNMDYKAGHDFADSFKKEIKNYIPDAEIVGEDYPPLNNKDFSPYVSKVIQSKAEAIITNSWGPDFTLMVKHSRELGLKPPFPFIAVFAAEPYFGTELKGDMVGNWGVVLYDMRINTPQNPEFVKAYHEAHKNDKDFNTWWPYGPIGQAYSGWTLIFKAMEKASSMDNDKIIEALEGFSCETVAGSWKMRACDHQVLYPLYGLQVKGGENPYFNGSIRKEVNFPWFGKEYLTISAEEIAPPKEYNQRCTQ